MILFYRPPAEEFETLKYPIHRGRKEPAPALDAPTCRAEGAFTDTLRYVFSGGARRLRRLTVGLASASEHSQPGEGSQVEAA